MNAYDYNISYSPKENDIYSKVYELEEITSKKKLIVKIYEEYRHKYYENEIRILNVLDQNNHSQEHDYFVMYKNLDYYQNMFPIPKDVRIENLKYLFFDPLPKLSLAEYLQSIHKKAIKEIHAKYLCYQLLIIIQKLHKLNINHNKIDISNIMFDEKFVIKLIHFSEASLINDNEKYKFNKDIYGVAKVIFKILTFTEFQSIIYDDKKKTYMIETKEGSFTESDFSDYLKLKDNINLSTEFSDFFHKCVVSKRANNLISIEELIKDKWLTEIQTNLEMHENKFNQDFSVLFEQINDDIKNSSHLEIDFEAFNNITGEQAHSVNCIEKEKCINPNFHKHPQNILLKPKKNIIHLKPDPNKKNKLIENGNNKQIKNVNALNNQNSNNSDKFILKCPNKVLINTKQGNNNNSNNIYKPRKTDFNYLEINIKNPKNEDIHAGLVNFTNIFKKKINDYYQPQDINVNIENISDISFKIFYEIPSKDFDDEIEFFDEDYEQKMKNGQKFEIIIELLKGGNNTNAFINQYYLVFNGHSIDKEDFYYHLKILKDLAKDILTKK